VTPGRGVGHPSMTPPPPFAPTSRKFWTPPGSEKLASFSAGPRVVKDSGKDRSGGCHRFETGQWHPNVVVLRSLQVEVSPVQLPSHQRFHARSVRCMTIIELDANSTFSQLVNEMERAKKGLKSRSQLALAEGMFLERLHQLYPTPTPREKDWMRMVKKF